MLEKSTQPAATGISNMPSDACCAWDWIKQKLGEIYALNAIRAAFYELGSEPKTGLANPKELDLAVIHLQNRNLHGLKELASELQANGKTQVTVMVDDWLQGYRRLLPPEIQTFYWYETYQVWRQFNAGETRREGSSERRPVFLFSNEPESRRSLCSALSEMGCTCVSLECCGALPAGKPELVIWLADTQSNPSDRESEFLRRLVIAYPDCVKFRVSEFPRFETAEYFLRNGIDFEIGAPYDLAAVLETTSLFSSAALRRR